MCGPAPRSFVMSTKLDRKKWQCFDLQIELKSCLWSISLLYLGSQTDSILWLPQSSATMLFFCLLFLIRFPTSRIHIQNSQYIAASPVTTGISPGFSALSIYKFIYRNTDTGLSFQESKRSHYPTFSMAGNGPWTNIHLWVARSFDVNASLLSWFSPSSKVCRPGYITLLIIWSWFVWHVCASRCYCQEICCTYILFFTAAVRYKLNASSLKKAYPSKSMKTFYPFSLCLSALVARVSGHCEYSYSKDLQLPHENNDESDIFERFTHGGTLYPVYQYIRQNSNYNSPIIDLTSNDLRSLPMLLVTPDYVKQAQM